MRESFEANMIALLKRKVSEQKNICVSMETPNVNLCLTFRPEWITDYENDKTLQIESDMGYLTISYANCNISFDDVTDEYIIKGKGSVFTIA